MIKAKPRKLSKVKAKPKPKKKPKYIDYGKIKALSDAGWSAPDIAADVHCGVSTVYNYLARLKNEE